MSLITVKDLPTISELDGQEMASIKGAGAPWIFGAFRSFLGESASASPIVNNYYQIDNSIHADKIINQNQIVEINNTGNNSNINAVLVSALNA
ncbi:MAG: hypothetical protein ACKVQT_27790 [Burkholderiales bacterium]